jgi:hypothetical protein
MVTTITIDAVNALQGFQPTIGTLTSSAASIAWNLNSAQIAKHTMTENTTLANPTNMVDGNKYELTITQHASAAKTLAYGSAYERSDDLPIISTVVGSVNILKFKCVGGTKMVIIDADINATV